jgi:hypothetical protein
MHEVARACLHSQILLARNLGTSVAAESSGTTRRSVPKKKKDQGDLSLKKSLAGYF